MHDTTNETAPTDEARAHVVPLPKYTIVPLTWPARCLWTLGIVIMLFAGIHFVVEFAPTIWPTLLDETTPFTDWIYSHEMSYLTAGLLFFVGSLFNGCSHLLRGANPWRAAATQRMTRWLSK